MTELWRRYRGKMLDGYMRIILAVVSLGLAVFAYDPLVNPDSRFGSEVFVVVRRIAPLETWGMWFGLSAVLMITATISGRFLVYLAAMFIGASAEVTWFVAVLWARWFESAPLTSGGIGLWIIALGTTMGALLYPNPLAERAELHIETPGGDVVPIREIAHRRLVG